MKKYEIHVPTVQFGFISCSMTGTPEEAVEEHDQLMRMIGGEGIPTKEFNRILDEYLKTGKVVDGGNLWEDMNEFQRGVFQEIKKSLKRTN
jgi:hypothetical protein